MPTLAVEYLRKFCFYSNKPIALEVVLQGFFIGDRLTDTLSGDRSRISSGLLP
jgi:hypothetical protein